MNCNCTTAIPCTECMLRKALNKVLDKSEMQAKYIKQLEAENKRLAELAERRGK